MFCWCIFTQLPFFPENLKTVISKFWEFKDSWRKVGWKQRVEIVLPLSPAFISALIVPSLSYRQNKVGISLSEKFCLLPLFWRWKFRLKNPVVFLLENSANLFCLVSGNPLWCSLLKCIWRNVFVSCFQWSVEKLRWFCIIVGAKMMWNLGILAHFTPSSFIKFRLITLKLCHTNCLTFS